MDIGIDNNLKTAVAETQTAEQSNGRKRTFTSTVRDIFSITAAGVCARPIRKTIEKAGCKLIDSKIIASSELCTKHNQLYKEAAFRTFENSGLSSKGVKMYESSELMKIANEELKITNIKEFPQYYINIIRKAWASNALDNPLGSAYFPSTKEVMVNMDKGASIAFHEMGHAVDYNKAVLSKLLSSSVPVFKTVVPALIIAVAVLRKEKSEGEESETKLGKGLDFVKKHCVALAAASQLPVLLQEGSASIRGINMAKKLLPKQHVKAMSGLLGKAFCSYLITTAAITTAVFAANKIRNWTASRRENTNNEEQSRKENVDITA